MSGIVETGILKKLFFEITEDGAAFEEDDTVMLGTVVATKQLKIFARRGLKTSSETILKDLITGRDVMAAICRCEKIVFPNRYRTDHTFFEGVWGLAKGDMTIMPEMMFWGS